MTMHFQFLISILTALTGIESADFNVYFEGAFDPMKQQDWAYRVFNANPTWPQIEKAKRFLRRNWDPKLDSGQIQEGFVGCLASSDCSVLRGCDRPCSADPGYSASNSKVFEMNFNSDPAVNFHWILYQDDPHKNSKGEKVAAAPDGGRWMYNVGSNVEPKGYCIEFPGDDYLGVKKELGDYFKHGTRKLRCIHPDVWGDDINDPEAYKRRTASKPEPSPEPSRNPGHGPQADCARQGNCESESTSTSKASPLGTLHFVAVASTTITKTTTRTVDATMLLLVPLMDIKTVSAYPQQTAPEKIVNPAPVPSISITTASHSLRNNRKLDSEPSAEPKGDTIPFVVEYSTTVTKTHVATVDSTKWTTVASTTGYTSYTVPATSAVVSSRGSSASTAAVTSQSSFSRFSPSISTTKVGTGASSMTGNLPSSSASDSVNPSLPAGATAGKSVFATSFVTVVIGTVSAPTTSYYDDGMWHTHYPVQSA